MAPASSHLMTKVSFIHSPARLRRGLGLGLRLAPLPIFFAPFVDDLVSVGGDDDGRDRTEASALLTSECSLSYCMQHKMCTKYISVNMKFGMVSTYMYITQPQ